MLSGYSGCVLVFLPGAVTLVLFTAIGSTASLSGSQVEAARLAGGEGTLLRLACRHAAIPAALAAVLAAILTLSDPGAGFAVGLPVASSEILLSFTAFYDYALAGRQSLLLTMIVLAGAIPLAIFAGPRLAAEVPARQMRVTARRYHRGMGLLAGAAALLALVMLTVLPAWGLILPLKYWRDVTKACAELAHIGMNTMIYAVGAGFCAAGLGMVLAFCAGRQQRLRRLAIGISLPLFALPPMFLALGVVRGVAHMPEWTDLLLRGRVTVCIALGVRFFPVAAILALRSWGTMAPGLARAAGVHGVSAGSLSLVGGAAAAAASARDGAAAGGFAGHGGNRHGPAPLSAGRGNTAFEDLSNPRLSRAEFAARGSVSGRSGVGCRSARCGLASRRRGCDMRATRFEARSLSKHYGKHEALAEVSFVATAGENLAILGASGSGKSTLLRLLAGLEVPDGGEILLDDEVVSQAGRVLRAPHRRGISLVFQDLALWPNLSAFENVLLGLSGLKSAEGEGRRRAADALRLCGIEELANRKPAALSGGQQQRVALARAIAVRPAFLLMDEPYASLDLILKTRLLAEVREFAALQDTTVILVTHDPLEALALCRSAIVLDQGRIVEAGVLMDLLERPRSELLRVFRDSIRGREEGMGEKRDLVEGLYRAVEV